MELNEAGRRIIGQHWLLILACLLFGTGVAAALHSGETTTYTASSRITLGTADPKTSSESLAIADTGWAIATAPSQLAQALRQAHVRRANLDEVAARIKVAGVGASGVLDLSYSDPDPRAAAAVANALAQQVRRTRAEAGQLELRGMLADVDSRIAKLNKRLVVLSSDLRPTPAAAALRDSLNQQRAVLETQRMSALFDESKNPAPSVVSPAAVPAHPDHTGKLADILLGAVLGLVLGAGLAAMLETFRPTLVGGDALARELDAPLLGTLADVSAAASDAEISGISWRLRMASRAAGIRNVGLAPLRRADVDVASLGQVLVGSEQELTTAAGEAGRELRSFDIQSSPVLNASSTGVVIVAPESIKRAELDELQNLLRVTPGPVLGVVTYRGAGPRRIARAHRTDTTTRRSA